jgi:hypothetical protein
MNNWVSAKSMPKISSRNIYNFLFYFVFLKITLDCVVFATACATAVLQIQHQPRYLWLSAVFCAQGLSDHPEFDYTQTLKSHQALKQ